MTTTRIKTITPFIVMDVLEKAKDMERQGINVIHFEVGEPDFDTPDCIKEAAIKALKDGHTHYTHSMGLIELREAICQHYFKTYNVSINPEQVIINSGTSPATFLLFSALLEREDEVIISDPHYACYPNFIKFLQGRPVTVPVYEEDGFQYRPESIEKKITGRTKGIFINSPSNPTGNLLSVDRMKKIAEFAPYIISDEIYHGLVYEGVEHSILEFTDHAFVLNGFSKLYAMTGLRLGYVIVPEPFVRSIQKIQQNFFISPNSMVQLAGIAALKEAGPDTVRMKETYNKRRKHLLSRLKNMGFGITVEPTGAFYVFANAKQFSKDSYSLAFDILEKAHVGVAPGIDFGEHGEGYLRFSYASSMENITQGMDRLEKYLKTNY
jgi:aspartate/methionine/tyrosine aminotransferase